MERGALCLRVRVGRGGERAGPNIAPPGPSQGRARAALEKGVENGSKFKRRDLRV